MAHNTIAEMKEILDALEQGKKIQYQMVNPEDPDKWCGYTSNTPNFFAFRYRVKPEEPKKKWRPFKDTAELFAHNNGNNILWLKRGQSKMLVTEYTDSRVTLDGGVVGIGELLKYFTFADGRPCGVEEDA